MIKEQTVWGGEAWERGERSGRGERSEAEEREQSEGVGEREQSKYAKACGIA